MSNNKNGKESENFDAKKKKYELFSHLDTVLEVSQKKFSKTKIKDNVRLKWGRLLVSAIESYGSLLEDLQLDDLELRLKTLEEEIQHGKTG